MTGVRLESVQIVDKNEKARCPDSKTQEKAEDFTLTVGTDMSDVTGLWILDSDSIRYLKQFESAGRSNGL